MEAPETKEVLDTTPSAPMATDEPSAPPSAPIDTFQSNECVICLENKCNIIFSALWSRLLLLELRKWPH